MKKIIAVLISMILVISLTGCSGKSGGDESDSFTMWIYKGVDSSYYTDTSENPAIKYALSKTWGPDKSKLSLEFWVPAAGAETDNLNTLLSTGEYADVMNLSTYAGTPRELYQEGIALDITDYVKEYMPNYMAYLESHPDVKAVATNVIDGEEKYLGLANYADDYADQWCGYMYRRDWIVKYGTNPTDGSKFTGEFTVVNEDGTTDPDSWKDNVVFPSGGSDPVYISDWEWMLEIFAKAQADLGITDGYGLSLYYPGYLESGELVNSFGGGGPMWYRNQENKAVFGATTDGFRTYLQCMSTWYKNGWLDKNFAQRNADMFYKIDDTNVRLGKVGIWIGVQSMLGGRLDNGEGNTDGIVTYGMSCPINDKYGPESVRNIEPYTMQGTTLSGGVGYIVTDKAKDKDIPALLSYFDYFYSEEGSLLANLGLSKEQYEETQDAFYTENGLTEGAYTVNADGTYTLVDKILFDGSSLTGAVDAFMMPNMNPISKVDNGYAESYQHSLDQWIKYTNTGFFYGPLTGNLTDEEIEIWNTSATRVKDFLSQNVPGMISGERDPFNDADWTAFGKALSKYKVEEMVTIFDGLFAAYPYK